MSHCRAFPELAEFEELTCTLRALLHRSDEAVPEMEDALARVACFLGQAPACPKLQPAQVKESHVSFDAVSFYLFDEFFNTQMNRAKQDIINRSRARSPIANSETQSLLTSDQSHIKTLADLSTSVRKQ